jgi:hypothetical protein
MRNLISVVTAAAFLFHLGVGCCVHHAHAAGTEQTECAQAVSSCFPLGHNKDAHQTDADPPVRPCEHSDPDGDTCHAGHCVFLTAVKITLSKLSATTWMAAVVPVNASKVIPLPFLSLDSVSQASPPLPVRLHLLHQQLLL